MMKRSSLITTTSHTLTLPGRERSSSKHNRAVSSTSFISASSSSSSLQPSSAVTSTPLDAAVIPPPHHRRNATLQQLTVVTTSQRSSISARRVSLKSPLAKRPSLGARRSIIASQHIRAASRISLKLAANALISTSPAVADAALPSPSSASEKQQLQTLQEHPVQLQTLQEDPVQQQEEVVIKVNGQSVKANEPQQLAVPVHLLGRRASKKLLQQAQQARRQDLPSTDSIATQPAATRNADPNKNFFSWEEIRQHNRPEDCWVVVHNKVYDVTKFVPYHPGGFKVLGRRAGEDATKDFAYHSKTAKSMIRKYHIGHLGQPGKGDESCVVQ